MESAQANHETICFALQIMSLTISLYRIHRQPQQPLLLPQRTSMAQPQPLGVEEEETTTTTTTTIGSVVAVGSNASKSATSQEEEEEEEEEEEK